MQFLPNNLHACRGASPGEVLVDTLRKGLGLCGTTVACREGDCGACTVLVGSLSPEHGELRYQAITSCISPAANSATCHVVTIEGLSIKGANPLQEILAQFSGTQCGFCTPGFIVSLTGFLLNSPQLCYDDAIAAIDGNICRCTGYKAIERAIEQLIATYGEVLRTAPSRLQALIAAGFLPAYFAEVPTRLRALELESLPKDKKSRNFAHAAVGGGSDLFVQKPHILRDHELHLFHHRVDLKGIQLDGSHAQIGAGTSIKDFCEHPTLAALIPCLVQVKKFFASSQIRAQASVGGNIINASPIGDLSNLFLALDAELLLDGPQGQRRVAQKSFYLGYKKLDLRPDEHLCALRFLLPDPGCRINFEKVSRRTHLDIASVNSAFVIRSAQNAITSAAISAGGVGPTPLRLTQLEAWLNGRTLSTKTVREAARRAMDEVQPISDVRGAASYKKLLLSKLIISHFVTCFPEHFNLEALLQ